MNESDSRKKQREISYFEFFDRIVNSDKLHSNLFDLGQVVLDITVF